jgi:hypothetical protein
VRADRLIPFNQMVVPTSNPQLVGVFYGQAYFMVKFLVAREGPGKFAELMRTMKSGVRYDQAIQRVYGLTMQQFEDAFRAAYGLAPRSAPTAAPTAAPTQRPQQVQPTPAPTKAPAQEGGSAGGDSGADRGLLIILGLAVLLALAAVFSWLVAMLLANNRERGTGGGPSAPGSGGS